MEESETDLYAYKLPVFVLLVANTFFLIWIMAIVVSKLRAQTAMDHDKRHWKAAKALVSKIAKKKKSSSGFARMLIFWIRLNRNQNSVWIQVLKNK